MALTDANHRFWQLEAEQLKGMVFCCGAGILGSSSGFKSPPLLLGGWFIVFTDHQAP